MRKLLLLGVAGCIVGTIIALVSPSLTVAAIGLFLAFGCRGSLVDLSYSYVPEFLAPDKGGQAQLLMSLSTSIGVILLGPVFWGIHPWELAYGLYQLVPFVVILLFGLKFFEETPIEQVKVYSTKESRESLLRIAALNNVECDLDEA